MVPIEKNFHKILIIQTAFIGDVILTIPLLRIISQNFSGAELHFLTIPNSANLVETLPYINKLWIYDKHDQDRGVFSFLKLIFELRKFKYDLVITPHRSFRTAILSFFSGISTRIGFNKSTGWFFFNYRVTYDRSIHEIERNLKLTEPLAIKVDPKELPEIFITDEDRNFVNKWMITNSISHGSKFLSVAPGSIWYTKRWPSSYWQKFAELFLEKGFELILIGSVQDEFLFHEINHEKRTGIHNAMGLFSLRQTGEIIRRSRLLISNDSAPTHLGVAVRTPVLTIFGSTIPEFGFYPYGGNDLVIQVDSLSCRPCTDHGRNKCPQKHFKCMLDLTPNMVFKTAWKMLNENS